MGYRKDGDTIVFDADYIGAWYEEQNKMTLLDMREQLDEGRVLLVEFQPGDGTRYEFTLVPPVDQYVICNNGQGPRRRVGDSDVLQAIVGNGMGDGIGSFNRAYSDGDRDYIMENIRHRIADKMSVPNLCTVEALAATIFSLWYMDD